MLDGDSQVFHWPDAGPAHRPPEPGSQGHPTEGDQYERSPQEGQRAVNICQRVADLDDQALDARTRRSTGPGKLPPLLAEMVS